MTGLEAIRALPSGERQGLALFATHGLGDGASTLLATAAFGAAGEANPIMASLLADGWGFAIGVKLALVGAVAIAYPRLSRLEGVPGWVGWPLAVFGAIVALLNLLLVGGLL